VGVPRLTCPTEPAPWRNFNLLQAEPQADCSLDGGVVRITTFNRPRRARRDPLHPAARSVAAASWQLTRAQQDLRLLPRLARSHEAGPRAALRNPNSAAGDKEHGVHHEVQELAKRHYRQTGEALGRFVLDNGIELVVVGDHEYTVPSFPGSAMRGRRGVNPSSSPRPEATSTTEQSGRVVWGWQGTDPLGEESMRSKQICSITVLPLRRLDARRSTGVGLAPGGGHLATVGQEERGLGEPKPLVQLGQPPTVGLWTGSNYRVRIHPGIRDGARYTTFRRSLRSCRGSGPNGRVPSR
jgi:hypothetical protein